MPAILESTKLNDSKANQFKINKKAFQKYLPFFDEFDFQDINNEEYFNMVIPLIIKYDGLLENQFFCMSDINELMNGTNPEELSDKKLEIKCLKDIRQAIASIKFISHNPEFNLLTFLELKSIMNDDLSIPNQSLSVIDNIQCQFSEKNKMIESAFSLPELYFALHANRNILKINARIARMITLWKAINDGNYALTSIYENMYLAKTNSLLQFYPTKANLNMTTGTLVLFKHYAEVLKRQTELYSIIRNFSCLTPMDIEIIYLYLNTPVGYYTRTTKDLRQIYNEYNPSKTHQELLNNDIIPLVEQGIFNIKYTNKSQKAIQNETKKNSKNKRPKVANDPNYFLRLKL